MTTNIENTKYEIDNSYDLTWEIERNNQKIELDIQISIDNEGYAYLDNVEWGGTEFILSLDEESDIISHIEEDVDVDEKEIDDD